MPVYRKSRWLRLSQAIADFRPLRNICNLLIILGISAIVAHAQLTTYVDDRGTVVFTNADKPVPRNRSKGASTGPKSEPIAASAIQTGIAPATSAASPSMPSSPIASPLSKPVAQALDRIVLESAQKNHVDPELVRAVISTESNWNSAAVSSKGALGLMQLVPGTARLMGVGDAFDPAQNVDGGVRYLRMLLERYNGDLNKALAAYNAGPGAVDRFGGVPDFPETRDYVRKVTSTYYRPSSNRLAHAMEIPDPIYRSVDAGGRLVFTNE